MINVIGLSGYAGSGKDEVAKIIQYLTSDRYKTGGSYDEFKVGQASPDPNGCIYEDSSPWEVKKYADKLKQIASILTGIPKEKFENQEFKKTNLGFEWGFLSIRTFLQRLGTDAVRIGLHDQTWVNALWADYELDTHYFNDIANGREAAINLYYPKWIITDCRFENEAKAIKDKKGLMVRVSRFGKPINDHPSETSLDGYQFDYTINNIGTIEDLIWEVKTFLKSYNVI